MGFNDPVESVEHGRQLRCEGEGSMCERHGSDVIMVKSFFCDDQSGASGPYHHY